MRPIDLLERDLEDLGATYKRTLIGTQFQEYYFFEWSLPKAKLSVVWGENDPSTLITKYFPKAVGINDFSVPKDAHKEFMHYWNNIPEKKRYGNCYYLHPIK